MNATHPAKASSKEKTMPDIAEQYLECWNETDPEARRQFPGFVFTLAGPVDTHHRQARFSWNLAPAGEEPVVVGSDVALTGPDGQITAVFGFLDQVPAA